MNKKLLIVSACCIIIAASASATRAEDPLNDGYPDIVISNVYSTDSYIYWGAATDPFTARTDIPTSTGEATSIADFNKDGYMDIVSANFSGTSQIFWGAPTSPYTTTTSLTGTNNAMGVSAADLNKDSYLDIVLSQTNTGTGTGYDARIYWGAATDPYTSYQTVSSVNAESSFIADLNKDSYQDIVFATRGSNTSYIYWGAETSPYTESSRTSLAAPSGLDAAVADLNRDGRLDIVFANWSNGSNTYVYWGDDTYTYTQKLELPVGGSDTVATADINNDGYFEIIVGGHWSGATYIYWGSSSYDYASRTELPVPMNYTDGLAVGDLNKDGFPDIVVGTYNYGGGATETYVFWGDAGYTYASRTDLDSVSPGGITISESPFYAANQAYGNVVPLWATDGGYGSDIINSWEYAFLDTQSETLNDGALLLSEDQIAQLTDIYMNQSATPVTIDNIDWSYYSEAIPGHLTPEAWYESGTDTYYFQMGDDGSGVLGEPAGADVPEPSTLLLLLPFIGFGVKKLRRTAK